MRNFFGELIGTFIMVLFGCGAVAGAVVFNAFSSLLEVALIWGIAVAIGIFASRSLSASHLNPAVSIAIWLNRQLPTAKLPTYFAGQFAGAMLAGIALLLIFGDAISQYESVHHLTRGAPGSEVSAMMFGEYFPNPGFAEMTTVGPVMAFAMEAFGTFLLVLAIFRLTEKEESIDNTTPLFIGLTVTLIICLVAPFTQAGLNPARDFGPRLVAAVGGWGEAAFCLSPSWSLFVYVAGPIAGGVAAVFLNRFWK